MLATRRTWFGNIIFVKIFLVKVLYATLVSIRRVCVFVNAVLLTGNSFFFSDFVEIAGELTETFVRGK